MVAVVDVGAVAVPQPRRIGADDHVRTDGPDHAGHGPAKVRRELELAVHEPEEVALLHSEDVARGELLPGADRTEVLPGHARLVRSGRAVGDADVVDFRPLLRPLRDGPGETELAVV